MRRPLLLALALLVVSAVVAVVLIGRDSSRPQSAHPSAVSLVGDSLNVGIEPYLSRYLRGWRISANDESGRGTATGIDELRAGGSTLAPALVISLGTNDDPTAVSAFRRDVRTVLRLAGPDRCVAWPTIARDGDAYVEFNDVLRQESQRSGNLHVVDWARMVSEHPEWLAADGIHATPDGYAHRARSVARVLRECTGGR